MNENDIKALTDLIYQNIKADANAKYLTGQFKNSIRIEKIDNGFRIVIDPKIYNLPKYLKTKVIGYKSGGGSYASHLDMYGSFKNNHFDYVGKAIRNAVRQWKGSYQTTYKIKADLSPIKKLYTTNGAWVYAKDVRAGYYDFGTEYLPSIY